MPCRWEHMFCAPKKTRNKISTTLLLYIVAKNSLESVEAFEF